MRKKGSRARAATFVRSAVRRTVSGLAGSRDRSSQRCHKLRSRGRAALHHLHHHRPSVRYFNLRRWTAGADLGQIAERRFTKPLVVDASAVAAEVLIECRTFVRPSLQLRQLGDVRSDAPRLGVREGANCQTHLRSNPRNCSTSSSGFERATKWPPGTTCTSVLRRA